MAQFQAIGSSSVILNDSAPTATPWAQRYRGVLVDLHAQIRKAFNMFPGDTRDVLFAVIRDRATSTDSTPAIPFAIESIATAAAKYDLLHDRLDQMSNSELIIEDRQRELADARRFLDEELQRDADVSRRAATKAAAGDFSPTTEWDDVDPSETPSP